MSLTTLSRGRVDPVQHPEDPLLHGLLLSAQALHLEPHVLGFPRTHPAGIEPGLVLGELALEHLQLPFGLVEVELQRLELSGSLGQLCLQGLLALVGFPVGSELGKGLATLEETVDLKIQVLDVEKVAKTGGFHGRPRVALGQTQV